MCLWPRLEPWDRRTFQGTLIIIFFEIAWSSYSDKNWPFLDLVLIWPSWTWFVIWRPGVGWRGRGPEPWRPLLASKFFFGNKTVGDENLRRKEFGAKVRFRPENRNSGLHLFLENRSSLIHISRQVEPVREMATIASKCGGISLKYIFFWALSFKRQAKTEPKLSLG